MPARHPSVPGLTSVGASSGASDAFDLDIDAVQEDLRALFVDSKDVWPADYGNYGKAVALTSCMHTDATLPLSLRLLT